jgi:hypothetical protein
MENFLRSITILFLALLLGAIGGCQRESSLPETSQQPISTETIPSISPSETRTHAQQTKTEPVPSQTSAAVPTPILRAVYPSAPLPGIEVILYGAGYDHLRLYDVYVLENYNSYISPSQYIHMEDESGLLPLSTIRGQAYSTEYEVPLAWITSIEAIGEQFQVQFISPSQGEKTIEGMIDSWVKGGSSVELHGKDSTGVEVQQKLIALPPDEGPSLKIEFMVQDEALSKPTFEQMEQIGTCISWSDESYSILEQTLEPLSFKDDGVARSYTWEEIQGIRFLENPWEGNDILGFPYWTEAEIQLRDGQKLQGSIESQLGYVTAVNIDGMVVHFHLDALSECSRAP